MEFIKGILGFGNDRKIHITDYEISDHRNYGGFIIKWGENNEFSEIFDIPPWQVEIIVGNVISKSVLFERKSSKKKIKEAVRKCELEVGLYTLRYTRSNGLDELDLEYFTGLCLTKVILNYANLNQMDYDQAKEIVLEKLRC